MPELFAGQTGVTDPYPGNNPFAVGKFITSPQELIIGTKTPWSPIIQAGDDNWDGHDWSSIAGSPDGWVTTMVFAGDDLYIGGDFQSVDGIEVNDIAKWNGSSWSAVNIAGDPHISKSPWKLFISGQNLIAQEAAPKPTVAVLDFIASAGIRPNASPTITNVFRSALIETDKYDVLERNDMESILEEQALSISGVCNSAECAVEIGQLLSAEKIILGDIGKIGKAYSINLRLVNVSSGKIEKSLDERFEGSAAAVIMGKSDDTQEPYTIGNPPANPDLP